MIRKNLKRYSDLFDKKYRSRDDLVHLVEDGTYLLHHGVLRDLRRLGRVKSEALRQIPEYPGTDELAEAIRLTRASRGEAVDKRCGIR